MQIDLGLKTNTQEREKEIKFLTHTLLLYVRDYLYDNRLKVSMQSIQAVAGAEAFEKKEILSAVQELNLDIPHTDEEASLLQLKNPKGPVQSMADYFNHTAYSLATSVASVVTGQDHAQLKTKKFILAALLVSRVEKFVNELESKNLQSEDNIRTKLKQLLEIVNSSIKEVAKARGNVNRSTLDDLLKAYSECVTNILSEHEDYKQIIKFLVADIKLNALFKAKIDFNGKEKNNIYIERHYALFIKTLIRIYILLTIDKTNRTLNTKSNGIKPLINVDKVHEQFSAAVEKQINELLKCLDSDINKENQITVVAGDLITDVKGFIIIDNQSIHSNGVIGKVSESVSSALTLVEYLTGFDNKNLLEKTLDALTLFKTFDAVKMLDILDSIKQTEEDNISDVISVKSPSFSNEDDIEIADISLDENKKPLNESKSTSYAKQFESNEAYGASPKSMEEYSNSGHDDQNEKRDGSSQITTASESGDNGSYFSSISTAASRKMPSNDSILSLSGIDTTNEQELERDKKINSSLKGEQTNMALSEDVIKNNKGSILGLFSAVKNNQTVPIVGANSEKKKDDNVKRTKSKNNKPGS